MPTDMNAAMRTKRRSLEDYMYEPPAESAEAELGIEEMPSSDTADTTESSAITVLAPDEPAAEDMYIYERMDNGAWMVYPPGVPCETGTSRIQLDHPATAAEYADMDAALGATGASDEPEESGAY